jgi:hypothetical protein
MQITTRLPASASGNRTSCAHPSDTRLGRSASSEPKLFTSIEVDEVGRAQLDNAPNVAHTAPASVFVFARQKPAIPCQLSDQGSTLCDAL